jgi:hypothetical protein
MDIDMPTTALTYCLHTLQLLTEHWGFDKGLVKAEEVINIAFAEKGPTFFRETFDIWNVWEKSHENHTAHCSCRVDPEGPHE